MAFLRPFSHDIFLSYAHVDNLPDRPEARGWVDEFAGQLHVRLLKRFGEDVDLWRDRRLRRVERFDEVIQRAVREAGVVVALLSNGYLRSEYCADELAWFCEKAASEPHGFVVDGHARIFPVLLYNFPHTDWPEACQGTLAFPFHDAERDDDHGNPLPPGGEAFDHAMRGLVEELYHVLRLLAREPAPANGPSDGPSDDTAGPAARPSEANGQTGDRPTGDRPTGDRRFRVFLAETAGEVGPTRRRLARELAAEGLDVVTGVPPPYEAEAHEAAVRQAAGEADLSVHLLTTTPGEPLDELAPARTYPAEQARIALEAARSTLVLLPETFDAAEAAPKDYAAFVASLEERPREESRLEVVRTCRSQMLEAVLAKRERLERQARRAAAAAGSASPTAFIDLHPGDVAHSADLVRHLAERHVVPMMIPSANLSPAASMALFEEHLRRATLFMVVYGTVAREWVAQRLTEAVKLIMSRELRTLIGVYLAPPRKQPDAVSFPLIVDVVDGMERLETDTLDALLQKAAAN